MGLFCHFGRQKIIKPPGEQFRIKSDLLHRPAQKNFGEQSLGELTQSIRRADAITHPGFSIGMVYYFFENRWFAAFVSPQVGWYIHPRNYFALFIEGNIGARFTARFGLFGELLGGLGYLQRWTHGGRVYSRDSDGSISSSFAAGSATLKVNGRFGFGWDFARNNLLPMAAFVRVGVFGEYPYNNYMLLHGSFEAGVIYRF